MSSSRDTGKTTELSAMFFHYSQVIKYTVVHTVLTAAIKILAST